jgi:hypothetical protein
VEHWEQIDFLIFFLGILAVYVILRLSPLLLFKTQNFNETWQIFANEMGFELKSGSTRYLDPSSQPEMSGFLHDREVKITSDFLSGIGKRFTLIHFSVSVENPGTQKLPAGAFLVIRKDPRIFSFWHRVRKSFIDKNEEPITLRDQYLIQSIPRNLGNFVFRQQTTEMLLRQPGVFNLYIDRDDLSYSLSGFVNRDRLMRQILENLCELADNFERFSRNWL